MIELDEVRKELILAGKEPEDFNIQIDGNSCEVTPKWYYEYKQIAKRENKPIVEDINLVAEFATITAMDKDVITEMLVYALRKIDELEAKVNG